MIGTVADPEMRAHAQEISPKRNWKGRSRQGGGGSEPRVKFQAKSKLQTDPG